MSVYDEIKNERVYRQGRWLNKVDDTKNTPWHWTAYIMAYATSWMCGTWAPLGENTVSAFRVSMIKIAAIAVAAVESIDRQREADGNTFYE